MLRPNRLKVSIPAGKYEADGSATDLGCVIAQFAVIDSDSRASGAYLDVDFESNDHGLLFVVSFDFALSDCDWVAMLASKLLRRLDCFDQGFDAHDGHHSPQVVRKYM